MQEELQTINFSGIARQASHQLGTHFAFAMACSVVLVWAVTGPLFNYSDTWQLVINTGTAMQGPCTSSSIRSSAASTLLTTSSSI
jgi:low affinity Fe/Cu permease